MRTKESVWRQNKDYLGGATYFDQFLGVHSAQKPVQSTQKPVEINNSHL